MRLSKNKRYQITKYYLDDRADENLGQWNGQEVRQIIGNAKYDEMFDMFFPASAKYGFSITEVK